MFTPYSLVRFYQKEIHKEQNEHITSSHTSLYIPMIRFSCDKYFHGRRRQEIKFVKARWKDAEGEGRVKEGSVVENLLLSRALNWKN